MSQYEPSDAEITGGDYQPYQSHPAGGQLQPVAQPSPTPTPRPASGHDAEKLASIFQFVLALSSLVAAIPISIVVGITLGLPGLLIAWVGIIGVNLVFQLNRRP